MIIDNLQPTDHIWEAVGAVVGSLAAIATVLLALYTRYLAAQTKEMAAETRDLVKAAAEERLQVERHHQQTLMPIIYVEANCGIKESQNKFWIIFEGAVVNIGGGPSTGINILFKPAGFVERVSYQGLIGPLERRAFKIEWQLTGSAPFQEQLPYDSITRFRTIFNTEGAVHQKSHSGLGRDSIVQGFVSPTDSNVGRRIAEMISNVGMSDSPTPI